MDIVSSKSFHEVLGRILLKCAAVVVKVEFLISLYWLLGVEQHPNTTLVGKLNGLYVLPLRKTLSNLLIVDF